MAGTNKKDDKALTGVANEGTWPGIDSRFRLIIVAGLRAKQLLHGSKPRIETNKGRRRNTSIALEEVKRGLVHFTRTNGDGTVNLDLAEPELIPSGHVLGKKNRAAIVTL
ncbi:MAG: DNA-directed RNA polymerase subunit omega [bacterium]